ncbi:MAG: prepilin peptidase [Alphaproteobacteria bacterium]|nr:prepilin peptidase [Alphaproteobacteria bacterium]MDE2340672.1 prepilin peptidase [Alphaproteobacteria bacterium]
MTHAQIATVLPLILILLLLIACVTDWRERIIPHWLNIGIAALAPIQWWVLGWHVWPDIAAQLGLGIGVLLVFILFQALGQMGGGDVKLLGALALWFPWLPMMQLLVAMAIFGGFLTLLMLILHRMRKSEGKPEIPYGIAIAAAGILQIYKHYFNHFS